MFTLSSLAPAFSVFFRETSEKSASEGASVSIDVERLRGTDASSARERSGAARASGSARVDDAVEPVASAFEASAPFPEDVAREWVLDVGHAEAFQGIARRAAPEKSCCGRRCLEKLERMREGFTQEALEVLAIAREGANGPEVPGIQRRQRGRRAPADYDAAILLNAVTARRVTEANWTAPSPNMVFSIGATSSMGSERINANIISISCFVDASLPSQCATPCGPCYTSPRPAYPPRALLERVFHGSTRTYARPCRFSGTTQSLNPKPTKTSCSTRVCERAIHSKAPPRPSTRDLMPRRRWSREELLRS